MFFKNKELTVTLSDMRRKGVTNRSKGYLVAYIYLTEETQDKFGGEHRDIICFEVAESDPRFKTMHKLRAGQRISIDLTVTGIEQGKNLIDFGNIEVLPDFKDNRRKIKIGGDSDDFQE